MEILQQLLFLILASVAIYFFAKNIIRIRRNIFLGKKENLNELLKAIKKIVPAKSEILQAVS